MAREVEDRCVGVNLGVVWEITDLHTVLDTRNGRN
jgi:hypothetical protein